MGNICKWKKRRINRRQMVNAAAKSMVLPENAMARSASAQVMAAERS